MTPAQPIGAEIEDAGSSGASARSSNRSAFGAHPLLNGIPCPENRLLRSYFRQYEFRHCTDSTELAHVQMGNDPIAALKYRARQHDLQLFIALSRIVVQNSDTSTTANCFELTNSR